ncbi:hypothetical protein ACHAQC_000354 [Fusarium culmorum]
MLEFKILLLSFIFLGAVLAGPAVPIQALALRQDNKFPNCDDKSQTYNGRYADNSGTYATSDKITHPYNFPLIRKCWWDYFVVEAAPELTPWQKATSNIYCTNSERCVATKMSEKSVCQERSESVSASVGVAIEGFQPWG